MLKQIGLGRWTTVSSVATLPVFLESKSTFRRSAFTVDFAVDEALKLRNYGRVAISIRCGARRRVRYEDEDEEEYGHNEEIAMLELYSQSARGEALLVHAVLDKQDVDVLIFKVSSFLSYAFFFPLVGLIKFSYSLNEIDI